MKLLLATYNPAKIKDYQDILTTSGFEVKTLNSLGIIEKFEENQKTFEENSRGKALFYFNLTKLPTIAEDGGLEIDFFNGQPGVLSRRWPGYEATDEELIEFIKEKIRQIPQNQRTARFTAVSCLVKSPSEIYLAKNSLEGYLTEKFNLRYPKGWPYRAFFVEKTFNKYTMDLSPDEYQQINHRLKNIERLIKCL